MVHGTHSSSPPSPTPRSVTSRSLNEQKKDGPRPWTRSGREEEEGPVGSGSLCLVSFHPIPPELDERRDP